MKKKSIVYIVVVMILSLSFTEVYANNINDLKKEQKNVESEMKDTKKKINKVTNETEDVSKEIRELDKEIEKNSADLEKIEKRLVNIENDIEKNTKELKEAEEALSEKEDVFNQRIRAMYMNGDVGYLELLLSSTDIKDFLSRKEVVQSIAEYDKELIKFMKEQRDIINEKRIELKAQRASVETTKNEIKSRKSDLEKATRKKSDLMGRLEKDLNQYKKAQAQLESDSKMVEDKLKKLQTPAPAKTPSRGKANSGGGTNSGGSSSRGNNSGGNSSGGSSSGGNNSGGTNISGGTLGWPVPSNGQISSYFGYRPHPIFGDQRLHTGIDISAATGASIVAAGDGRVISASWMGGYGNTVIIDHGGGIATLYAHNSSIVVSNGQTVSRGSTIARAGSTGNSTGPHCHFEVRRNGSPINPMPWLR